MLFKDKAVTIFGSVSMEECRLENLSALRSGLEAEIEVSESVQLSLEQNGNVNDSIRRSIIQLRTCERFLHNDLTQNLEKKIQKQRQILTDLTKINRQLREKEALDSNRGKNSAAQKQETVVEINDDFKEFFLGFLQKYFPDKDAAGGSGNFWEAVLEKPGATVDCSKHSKYANLLVKNGLAARDPTSKWLSIVD